MSAENCKYFHSVIADINGSSFSGAGCLLSGGHCLGRCINYVEKRFCKNCGTEFTKEKNFIYLALEYQYTDNLEEIEHLDAIYCSKDCIINHLTGVENGNISFEE